MKKWKAFIASILTASVLLVGVPLGVSAQENLNYSIFDLPKSGQLKQGDRGENVKILQRALNQVVTTKLVADGVYGQKTKNAVLKFQQTSKDLKDTGIYDRSTHDALSKKINSANFTNAVLKEGNRGEAVNTLQKALNDLGYGLKVDGHYGSKQRLLSSNFKNNIPS